MDLVDGVPENADLAMRVLMRLLNQNVHLSNDIEPNLSLLLKMRRKDKDIKDRMLSNQTAYDEKLFKGKCMADLQKYLTSLHKRKQYLMRCTTPSLQTDKS